MKFLFAACAISLAFGTAHAGNPEAGKEKSRTCAACHGPDGNSAAGDFPRLAGQHYDYLLKAMKDYKSGARKNPMMMPMMTNVTSRDMEDLAAFYSEQQGLITRKHAHVVR
jgi:cytochrome c553